MPFVTEVQNEQGARLAGFAILRDQYRFPDDARVTVRADVGWCRDCRAFALVERLLTAAELDREAEDGFFAMHPEERPPYVQWNMRQVLAGWKERSAREYRPLLDYLPRRKSPARCLECGGTDFVRFEEWNRWYEHPEGSGKFQVVYRGHIDATYGEWFDPEGRRLGA